MGLSIDIVFFQPLQAGTIKSNGNFDEKGLDKDNLRNTSGSHRKFEFLYLSVKFVYLKQKH